MTVAEYVLPVLPDPRDLGGVLNAASELFSSMPGLYMRVLSDLAMMGEQVEQALGLPPLPEPPVPKIEEPDKKDAKPRSKR